jgi:hypothetical protein
MRGLLPGVNEDTTRLRPRGAQILAVKERSRKLGRAAAPEGEHRGTLSAKVRGKPYDYDKARAVPNIIYLQINYILRYSAVHGGQELTNSVID